MKDLAHTRPDQGRITVNLYDPIMLRAIDKTLKAAGFNSYVFSKTAVVVNIPRPTSEDRDQVVAHVKKLTEEQPSLEEVRCGPQDQGDVALRS